MKAALVSLATLALYSGEAAAASCGTVAAPTACSITAGGKVTYTFTNFSLPSSSASGGATQYAAADIGIDVSLGAGLTALLSFSKTNTNPGVVFLANAGQSTAFTMSYKVTISAAAAGTVSYGTPFIVDIGPDSHIGNAFGAVQMIAASQSCQALIGGSPANCTIPGGQPETILAGDILQITGGTGNASIGGFTNLFDARFCPAIAKGDFGADARTDLLLDNLTNNRNALWTMNGITLAQQAFVSPDTGANQQIAASDDFNADGRSDLVVRDQTTGALEFWLMNGATRVGSAVPIGNAPTLGLGWQLAATGDFNADANPDLLWRNTTSQKLVIWTMNGTNKLASNIIPSPDQAVNANWQVVAALDYDGDGTRDLLWYNTSSGNVVQWLMNASVVRTTGRFTNPTNAGNANWKVLAGGDYGVGAGGVACTSDVVWRNSTSGKQVVWYLDLAGNRTAGVFTSPDSPTVDPDGNPTAPTDWTIAGPR